MLGLAHENICLLKVAMMAFLNYFNIRQINFWDFLDIVIIWSVLYSLFRFMRGRPTVQIALGLFALFLAKTLAELFSLVVVAQTIGWLFNIIPVAVIVLFQDEIRTVLASIGSNPFFNRNLSSTRSITLDHIFQSALTLSKSNTGALYIFERDQGLRTYMETGSRIDALPNTELLIDIFQPKNNLHDGAVIISHSRIAAAACIMPLARGQDIPKHFGTRHRAGIGITEETDSISLIVSEETGGISFAQAGKIYVLAERNLMQMYETYSKLRMPDGSEKKDNLKPLSKLTFRKIRKSKDKSPRK